MHNLNIAGARGEITPPCGRRRGAKGGKDREKNGIIGVKEEKIRKTRKIYQEI